MATEIAAIQRVHKLSNGLTPLLSKSLSSQELVQHRATVGFELEVLAKQVDRFGWEKDRGKAAHNRVMTDWMDALQDYPLGEVQAACRASVMANPNKMPNYGHVKAQIEKARAAFLANQPKPIEPTKPTHTVSEAQKAEANRLAARYLTRATIKRGDAA